MGRHASFAVVEDTEELLCIRDTGDHSKQLTITNDAEYVVQRLARRLKGRRLEYYDTMGERDQLLVEDGKFAGFAPTSHREKGVMWVDPDQRA